MLVALSERLYFENDLGLVRYHGPESISLPDFGDALTRMVYSGSAHSFMPRPRLPYRVLAEIELHHLEELHGVPWGDLALTERAHSDRIRMPEGHVVTLGYENVLIYLTQYSELERGTFDLAEMRRELRKLESLLNERSGGYLGIGDIFRSLAPPMYAHITLLGKQICLMGIGPHYKQYRSPTR